MGIEAKFKEKYSDFLENFKTLSRDSSNQQSLCQNTTHKYYDFDKIVKDRNRHPTPASPDTLIFKDDKIYCVEFKNSLTKRIKARIIKKKLENGYQVLLDIFKELDLQIKDYKLIFCVVHKGFDDNKKRGKIHNRINNNPTIRFGLKQFKGKYFDDIIINDVDFFRDQFIEKIDQNLPC